MSSSWAITSIWEFVCSMYSRPEGRLTGTGKIRRSKAYRSHILTKKSTKRKRNLRKGGLVSDGDHAKVKAMLPYA